MESERIDKVLVSLGLVATRSQALQLIKEGIVYLNDNVVKKTSFKVSLEDREKIEIRKEHLFVGRGAHKLEGAHKEFNLNFKDKVIADVGASTGGFTEYALINGAQKVFAIDVGHDQLAFKLKNDSKVINMEGVNIKNPVELEVSCDMAVVDLSFISLKLVAKNIADLVKYKGKIVFLVKPQFEVGRQGLGKKGIVKDLRLSENVLEELKQFLTSLNILVLKTAKAAIKGKTGNQEYLFYCQRDYN